MLYSCKLPCTSRHISIWFFIKVKKLKGRKKIAWGQAFVVQKPQQSRKRDSAAGTPFHALPRRARLSPPHPTPPPRGSSSRLPPASPQVPRRRGRGHQRQVPPAARGEGGEPLLRPCARLPEPQRPEGAPPALHAPAPLRVRPARGRGSVRGAPGVVEGPAGAPAPRPSLARTHRRRPALRSRHAPGRAAAGAAAGGEAGGPRPGAPGPCRRRRRRVPPGAPATPPAAPRRRDKAAGAAGRGAGRPLPAPRRGAEGAAGSQGGGGARALPPARPARPPDACSLRSPWPAHLLRACRRGVRGTRGDAVGPLGAEVPQMGTDAQQRMT